MILLRNNYTLAFGGGYKNNSKKKTTEQENETRPKNRVVLFIFSVKPTFFHKEQQWRFFKGSKFFYEKDSLNTMGITLGIKKTASLPHH